MNIIDIKTYPKYLLLLGVVLLSASCHREDPVEQEHLGIPIQLAADTHWPDLTKGTDDLIKNEEDFDGFVVWANVKWDNSNSISVFGINGTKVYSPNWTNEPAQWTYEPAQWTYEPAQYWQMGTYNFAAVLPASSFAPENYKKGDAEHGSFTGKYDGSELTLSFGEHGFNLSENQTDLMVAFQTSEIDDATYSAMMNGAVEPEDVNLNFSHQLALLNFTITNTIKVIVDEENQTSFTPSINIKNIKIYGNHSAATSAKFIDTTTGGEWELSSVSSSEYPYYNYNGEYKLPYSTTDEDSFKIPDLLVFPESCNLTVEVTYTEVVNNIETSERITKSATLSGCTWLPGTKYTYSLNISRSEIIFFGEPTVEEWVGGGSAGNIEIK